MIDEKKLSGLIGKLTSIAEEIMPMAAGLAGDAVTRVDEMTEDDAKDFVNLQSKLKEAQDKLINISQKRK